MNDIIMFDPSREAQLPAYLQGADNNVNAGLLAVASVGGNRIGLKGSRFRLVVAGVEEAVLEQTFLDVHVVGVFPHISRVFYANGYDPSGENNGPPTCYSADGDAPPDDVLNKQAERCAICPQNVKGSKISDQGQKTKACGFFQRLVVMLPGDPDGRFYRLDVKAQGLFGEGIPAKNQYNLIEYGKAIANRNVDVSMLVTRLSFDPNSSTPKLLFQPTRYVTADEHADVQWALTNDALPPMIEVNMKTVDLSDEDDTAGVSAQHAPVQTTPVQTAPVQTAQTTPARQAPARQTPARQAPAQQAPAQPAPEPEKPAAPAKKQYKLGKTPLGEGLTVNSYLDNGWTADDLVEAGYIEEIKPEPAPKPSAPPPPAKAAAKPSAPPPPRRATTAPADATPAVQRVPAPGTPVAATPAVTEIASSAELKALLDELAT